MSSSSESPLAPARPILPSPSTFPKLCCLIPTQDTQRIDSPGSPRALHLPPRVSRRYYAPDNCYLVTPVSPESPTPNRSLKTLESANQLAQLWPTGAAKYPSLKLSVCAQNNLVVEEQVVHLAARSKAAFVPVPVPVIEPLQIFVSPTVVERPASHKAGGRPIMTTPDLRYAARFDAENNDFDVFSNFRMRPEADIVQLNALDSKLAIGLKPKEFWALFSKCAQCNLFVTSRSMEYHKANQCQNDGFLSLYHDVEAVSNEWFLPLLDSTWHDPHVTHIAGVPPNVFEKLFAVCRSCDSHMAARVSRNHQCREPSPNAARPKEF